MSNYYLTPTPVAVMASAGSVVAISWVACIFGGLYFWQTSNTGNKPAITY